MADYTLACDTVVIVNPPVPFFKIDSPKPSVVAVVSPDMDVIVRNPPRLSVRVDRPNSINIVLPVAGPAGPAGPPGQDGSSSFYYEHDQSLSSAGWTVHHNLGKYPNVAVIVAGETIGVSVQHVDTNTLYIPFAIPVTGKVICS